MRVLIEWAVLVERGFGKVVSFYGRSRSVRRFTERICEGGVRV